MILRHDFTLSITQRAPFLQRGLAQASIGHDATPLLDQQGRLILSGDQIEGHVAALMDPAQRAKWFGKLGIQLAAGVPEAANKARRSNVKIFDLVAKEKPKDWQHLTRVEIDDATGASKPGSLQVIAQSHKPGADVTFTGAGWVLARTRDEAAGFLAWLCAALEVTPALGAIKSGGFGEIVAFDVQGPVASCPLAPASVDGPAWEACALQLAFDQPFLVDPDIRSGNVYDSAEIVPGNIIKGAIADMLGLAGKLGDYNDLLTAMTIRHAMPGAARPKIAPLSLAVVGERLVDVLAQEPDGVPKFQIDWKDKDWTLATAQGWFRPGQLGSHVRTRTAVGANNVAAEGQLFSQRMIATHDGYAPLVWNSACLLPKDADAGLRTKLGALKDFLREQGILRIGKTAAPVTVAVDVWHDAIPQHANAHRITLQTPAWMIPRPLLERGTRDARALYAAYFKTLGGTLIDFVALTDWSGGARVVKADQPYYPWLMTRAGSVFIVEGLCAKTLSGWQRIGLPLPETQDWTTCPFVRENGFGEIRVERHG